MIDKIAAPAAAILSLLAICATMSPALSFTADEILDRNELSLVRISVSGIQRDGQTPFPPRTGIGFFISKSGHIVTALHVVGQHELFKQDLYNRVVGRKVKVQEIVPAIGPHTVTDNTRNVVLSPYADVALVKVSPKTRGGTYDPIDHFNTCRPSGAIIALVWRGERPEAVSGIVKQAEETNTGGLVRFGAVGAHIEDGDSGGPVFDSEGRLIGVLSGRDLDNNDDAYFVPIADGASLLFNVAQIRSCYELNKPISEPETLSSSISVLGERLNNVERSYVINGPGVADAFSKFQCVTDKQFQALSSQIEIIFLNNRLEGLKRGDLKEDIGSDLTLYSVENRMRSARKEVEELLEQIKDGTCG